LIELRPANVSAPRTLAEAMANCAAPTELACASGWPHGGSQHMVIMAGIGLGKTECFALPVLSSLLEESRSWTGSPALLVAWWRTSPQTFRTQCRGERGRTVAVRALILYPMNARSSTAGRCVCGGRSIVK
jgi:hypothetical protein